MNESNTPRWGLRVWAVLVGLILAAPLLIVIPASFSGQASFAFPPSSFSLRWYEQLFTDPKWLGAISKSLWIALLVTVISTSIGTLAALGLRKMAPRYATLANGILIAPMVVPGMITAVATYAAFIGWGLTGNLPGFLLAHTVLALPFVVVSVSANLQSTDPQLEKAAASMGAGPIRTFFKVTLPGILPGVGAGALFAFIASLDEVVVSNFLQSPLVRTLPIEMLVSMTNEVDPTIAAVATVVLAATTLVLILPFLFRKPQEQGK